ncbi:hypothetical protein NLJ89_g4705 [Agrocybe chaxingu]|uniref:DUF7704 domain-containing protein n=1 Tax=Agrocybe chaxingu TaxID=84603 RepID=A0A9W8MXT8_9AGAR|nr:hypothetical protein NLJ89_g4705 [Agrocybe chaxingu]
MTRFDALPGYYKFIFLYLEPLSEIGPFIMSVKSGPAWFYNELVPPTGPPPVYLDPRTEIAIWQLTICYILLFLIATLGFRAIRDTLPDNPAGQERLVGIILFSLAIADITHMFLTFRSLPPDIKYQPHLWNTTTHGNLTFVGTLHVSRLAWFSGVGRKRYYFGQPSATAKLK